MANEHEDFFNEFAKMDEELVDEQKTEVVTPDETVLDDGLPADNNDNNDPQKDPADQTEVTPPVDTQEVTPPVTPKDDAPVIDVEKIKAEIEAQTREKIMSEISAKEAEKVKFEESKKAEELAKAQEQKRIEEDKNFNAENVWSEEDKKFFKDLEKDFPEVSKSLALIEKKIKAQYEKTLERAMTAFEGHMQKKVNPIYESFENQRIEMETQKLLSAHPDAFEQVDNLKSWIKSLPETDFVEVENKKVYEKVLNSNNSKELIALFNRFKGQTGIAQRQAQEAENARLAAEAAAKQAQEAARVEQEKQKKAQALAAVSSRNTQTDANPQGGKSFKDYFDEFSK